MARTRGLQSLAILLCWIGACAQTTKIMTKLTPLKGSIQTGLTVGPGLVVTPAALAHRRLSMSSFKRRRSLLQDTPYQTSGPVPTVSIEFARTVLAPLSPGNNLTATRRILLQSATPQLTFYGLLTLDLMTEQVKGSYVFDSTAQDFLRIATQSGTTFRFLRALLLYPQEQTPYNVPAFVVSPTGFMPADPSHPTIVKLTTQGATSHVPTIGLRFDYQQSAPGTTPFISLYYTDQVGTFAVDGGLPLPCLTQDFTE